MRSDLIETFKIIKSTNQLDVFANRVIYFWNKLPNQIKNSNKIKKLRLNWMILEKMVRKSLGHFWKVLEFDLYYILY